MNTSGAGRPALKAEHKADTVSGILAPARSWRRTLTFARGFMLESDCKTLPEDTLFIGAGVSCGPYHILLPQEQVAFLLAQTAENIRSSAGILYFDAMDVDLGSGRAYSTAVPRLTPEGAAFGYRELTAFLYEHSAINGLGFPAHQAGEGSCPLPLTARDAAMADSEGIGTLMAFVEFLVGRGPGLTPSGDDFLVGMKAVLPAWQAFGEALRQRGLLSGVTTTVSQAYFRHALAGQFDRNLVLMAVAMNQQRRKAVRHVFQRIAAHGHSSGVDMLSGVLFALQAGKHINNTFIRSATGK